MRIFSSFFLFICFSVVVFAQVSVSIPQIQGSGQLSPYANQSVRTTGIVTAKFIGQGKINGYFLQDALGDNNQLTSDGIFVYTTADNVSVGDKVEVVGLVKEYYDKTELINISSTTVINSNNPLPVVIVNYAGTNFNWEQYEGMMIEFDQTLYVTDNSGLEQYGQLSLSPTRKYIPTNQYLPLSQGYTTLVSENAISPVLLDDGITTTFYKPISFADINGTRRVGERVNKLRVVVDYTSSKFVVYPAASPVFYGNSRPLTPVGLGNYNLKVCAFNLEYYLTTNYGQGYGPNNETEAARQHTKIMTALLAIDADIYGLIEIEQGQDALIKIVNALNTATVPGRYSYIDDGGTIYGTYTKVGFIYRTDKVSPYLQLKNNNSPSPLHRKKAQAFTLKSNNERFIFSVNHFKAKSGCSSATGLDADKNDGQSCYNYTRVQEANSTVNFLNSCKRDFVDEDVLIMGDLNAYAMEDPVQALVQAGYVDLHRAFHADSAYSYVYRGEAGYLDYALASSTLRNQITGVSAFHINTDEPSMFEYSASAYQPDMYRCSDHDPVVVGISLGKTNKNNILNAENVKIRPTLADDSFVISNARNSEIQLYTISGVLLKNEFVLTDDFTVDISKLGLSTGVYLVRVRNGENINRLTFMKK